ncbi:MAG: hypothetical protein AAF196_15180 [Planctomycetota bacterium]
MLPLGTRALLATAIALTGTAALRAQVTPVPLNYNFNGIVHAGEAGQPDSAIGFRSISDRALDFTAVGPVGAGLEIFEFIDQPNTLDIVHLGNRNAVDNGNRAFDSFPDGDAIGTQPVWLLSPNQSAPQITTLLNPIPVANATSLELAFQISNGGGSFDVTVRTTTGGILVSTVSGPDWFGGGFPGTDNTDTGSPGPSLVITQRSIDLSALASQAINRIEFSNRSNSNGGYAILAATVNTPLPARRVNQVALNYNFNGIVHAGESGSPDAPNGFRSISDRALDFTGGIPIDPLLEDFQLQDAPNQLDIVHLGNRNTVDGGSRAFEVGADGDAIGTQPLWLTDPDQSVPQVTDLQAPILLDSSSTATVLFQVSNGGGGLDVVFDFASGNATIQRVTGGDWFGGPFPGMGNIDAGTPSASLNIESRTINLSNYAGEVVTRVAFANATNPDAGYAILAMNLSGCLACANDVSQQDLGGGLGGIGLINESANLGCDLVWLATGLLPNSSTGFVGFDLAPTPVAFDLSMVFPACTGGTLWTSGGFFLPLTTDGLGSSRIEIRGPRTMAACGAMLTAQIAELRAGPCPLVLSNGLQVTIGN